MTFQEIAQLSAADLSKAKQELIKKATMKNGTLLLSVGNKWSVVKPLISMTQQNPEQQPIDVQFCVPNLQGMKIVQAWI